MVKTLAINTSAKSTPKARNSTWNWFHPTTKSFRHTNSLCLCFRNTSKSICVNSNREAKPVVGSELLFSEYFWCVKCLIDSLRLTDFESAWTIFIKCFISISLHPLVPLPEYSTFVLQQVVDLFYNGQIMVGAEVKPRIQKALQFLKVGDVLIQNAAAQPNSTSNSKGMKFYDCAEWNRK